MLIDMHSRIRMILLPVVLLLLTPAGAQSLPEEVPQLPRSYNHEVGMRFGAQMSFRSERYPELQFVGFDYACYGWRNIGLRTGLELYLAEDITGHFAVPLQFSWRIGGTSMRFRSRFDCESASWGDLFLSFLPLAFELHAGFTPGVMGGPTEIDPAFESDPASPPFLVSNHFCCTFDAGARLMIPIWRFSLFCDLTYHARLTDNLRAGDMRPSRSTMGISGGLSFLF